MLGSKAREPAAPPSEPRIPVAAKDRAALEKYIGHCETLATYTEANVLVVRGYAGDLQLWVSPSFSGYRKAWIDAFGPILKDHDVDHIYSKNRGKLYGYAYVRVALVDFKANRRSGEFEGLMGKVFEENRTLLGHAPQAPEIRYADDVQELKLKHVYFQPSRGYDPVKRDGEAILDGTRLKGKTTALTPLAQRVTVPLSAPRATAPTAQVKQKGWKAPPPKRTLQVTAVTLQRTGQEVQAVTAPKSYEWAGSVVEWLMGALISTANAKRTEEALEKILSGVEPHLPKGGGALIAVVYEEPNNADQYGYSTALFLYAHVLAYGATAQEAYQRYQEEASRPGYATLSPAARKNWSKVERHVWVQVSDR